MKVLRECIALLVVALLGQLTAVGWAEAQAGAERATSAFYVREIRTDASEILTDEEIEAVTREYQGAMVTLEELNEVVSRLNELYAQRGYVTAKAILAPQTIEDGVVHVTLVEGKVGEISVQGNRSTQPSYVLRAMSLRPGDLVKLERLEADIAYFNAINDVQLRAELQPGETFGATDYVLHVAEPARWQGSLSYANSGRGETGEGQRGLTLASRSLFGFRDALTLSLIRAEGTTAGSFSYSLPYDRWGSRIGLTYYQNQIRIIAGEFESVDISGESSGGSLVWSRPLAVEAGTKVLASIEYHEKESGTYFSGAKLIGGHVRAFVYGLTSQHSNDNVALTISHRVSHGKAESGAEQTPFTTYNGNLSRQWMWINPYRLTYRTTVQLAATELLPASEQFQLGGVGTLRGLSAGELIGDGGYQMSLEVARPLANGVEAFAFVDHGAAYPYKGNDEPYTPEDYATSVGIGATVGLKHLSGNVVYGIPLDEDDRPESGWGRLHFRVEVGF